jgi:hypothetical protein
MNILERNCCEWDISLRRVANQEVRLEAEGE